jgi:hypothetical protein
VSLNDWNRIFLAPSRVLSTAWVIWTIPALLLSEGRGLRFLKEHVEPPPDASNPVHFTEDCHEWSIRGVLNVWQLRGGRQEQLSIEPGMDYRNLPSEVPVL